MLGITADGERDILAAPTALTQQSDRAQAEEQTVLPSLPVSTMRITGSARRHRPAPSRSGTKSVATNGHELLANGEFAGTLRTHPLC